MKLSLTVLILVVLLGAWLIVRRRQKGTTEAPHPVSRRHKESTAYHAVSIKFDTKACSAAKALEGRRFLSTAAPKLPLPDCDALDCKCRFVHHKDRRTGKDRRSPFGAGGFGAGTGRFESEQRTGNDRRADSDEELF